MSSSIFKIYFNVKLRLNLFVKTFENDPLKDPLNGSATKQSVIVSKYKVHILVGSKILRMHIPISF